VAGLVEAGQGVFRAGEQFELSCRLVFGARSRMVLIVALRKRWPLLLGNPAEQAALGRLSPGFTGVPQ
jgi:hypothetical protein